jgi:hypothetical protein
VIELKILDMDVEVRVNGKRVGVCDEDSDADATMQVALHHGDLVQFDERHEFRVYGKYPRCFPVTTRFH